MRVNKKPLIWICVIAICFLLFYLYTVFAFCAENDCMRKKYPGSKYCYYHLGTRVAYHHVYHPDEPYTEVEQRFMEENSYIFEEHCDIAGCRNSPVTGGRYCSIHTCHEGFCILPAIEGSKYCSSHSEKTTTGAKGNSGYSYSSSDKKTTWPDCDDYEDRDDFLDDWDGEMPNGMDAEDYWDDW